MMSLWEYLRDLPVVTILQNMKNIECYLLVLERLLEFVKETYQSGAVKQVELEWNGYRSLEVDGREHVVEKLERIEMHIKVRDYFWD